MALICQKRIACDSSSVVFPPGLSSSSKPNLKTSSLTNISRAQMTKNYSISPYSTRTKDSRTHHVSTTSTTSVNIPTAQIVTNEKDESVDVYSTFANFIVKNLKKQRSLEETTHATCDVILRCGASGAVPVHSCILVAISRFFRRLLGGQAIRRAGQHGLAVGIAGGALDVDVGDLFRSGGLENHFSSVIEALYEGKRFVSQNVVLNKALSNMYAAFELESDANFELVELATNEYHNTQTSKVISDPLVSSRVQPTHPQKSAEGLSEQSIVISDKYPDKSQAGINELDAPDPKDGDEPFDLEKVSSCNKCNLFFMSDDELCAHKNLRNCSRKFVCQPCGKIHTSVRQLVSHLVEAQHGEIICSVCNFAVEVQEDMICHIQRHASDLSKPYFCHLCESRFSTRKRWDQHLPKHSTEAPHVCPVCNKGFKWKHALTAHMVVHSSEKKFLCQECGFSTSHASTFKFHQRNHNGQLMKCEVVSGCKFQTTRKSNLLQHQLTHSKDKPHQCEVCGRSFSLAKNMRRHARQHDTNATIYACKVGGCSFNSLRSDKYLEHMKRYHPAPSSDQLSSSTSSSSTVKTLQPSTQVEAAYVSTSKVTPSVITQHPIIQLPSPPSQTDEGMQIIAVESPLPTTTHSQNPVEQETSMIHHLQVERSNQSSPIPTKNVDTGGGRNLPMIVNKHSKTSPVIGVLNMASHNIVIKEDSMDSDNKLINQIVSTSTSSDISMIGSIVDQEDTEMQQVMKITRNTIDGNCTSSFGPTTHVVSSAISTSTAVTMEDRSSRLAKNVFNTISPPNKTVTDALTTFSDTPPVPLEEPSVFSTTSAENIFSHGGDSELDAVVDSVISNSNSSLQF